MKKFLLILTLALLAGFTTKAQEDDNDKIRDKMREFIQKRLNLSKNEAEKFTPVFIRYFREWRQNIREPDILLRDQKIAEIKVRYRTEFREIVGDKRSNEVYRQQKIFIDNLKRLREDQIKARNERLDNKRSQSLIQ
jgi:hypothetical protein